MDASPFAPTADPLAGCCKLRRCVRSCASSNSCIDRANACASASSSVIVPCILEAWFGELDRFARDAARFLFGESKIADQSMSSDVQISVKNWLTCSHGHWSDDVLSRSSWYTVNTSPESALFSCILWMYICWWIFSVCLTCNIDLMKRRGKEKRKCYASMTYQRDHLINYISLTNVLSNSHIGTDSSRRWYGFSA